MSALSEKVIVVTGASSGVGRAIAGALAKQGAVLVLAARSAAALDEVVNECKDFGAEAQAVLVDMRKPGEVERLVVAAMEIKGRVDGWVNNAGVMAIGRLDQVPAEINEEVIRTNLLGYINGAQSVLPVFKKQGFGILVNNISVGGWLPTPYATAYSASKFGLRGFSEALKGELAPFPDIYIVDLYPSFLDTPGLQHAANYTGKVIKPMPPLIDPRTVADVVVQLLVYPRARRTIGFPTVMLRLSYSLFPRLTREATGFVIRKYLRQAEDIAVTPGNTLEPVEYGTSIDGGWRKPVSAGTKFGFAAVLAAGLGAFVAVRRAMR